MSDARERGSNPCGRAAGARDESAQERGLLAGEPAGHRREETDLLCEEVGGGEHLRRRDSRGDVTLHGTCVPNELGRAVERGGELFDEVAARSESKDG